MKIDVVPELPLVALRAPRKFVCYALPETPLAPLRDCAAVAALAAAAAEALCVAALTPVVREVAPRVWLCAFFHGEAHRRWVATYERDRPGRVAYIPRTTEVALIDCPRGLLYLSCAARSERGLALLPAFNGTLFPGRRPAAPFFPLRLDLAPFRLLGPGDRRPALPGGPWAGLALKSMTWGEAGEAAPIGRLLWPDDGYAEFDVGARPWPEHLRSLAFAVRPAVARRACVAELYQGVARLRATLAPPTLAAVGALLDLARTA